MIHIQCQCGEPLELPASVVGQPMPCPACGQSLRPVSGGGAEDATDAIVPRLAVRTGPLAGGQFFLVGGQPIEIGKLPEKPIHLPGTQVSRGHCRLVRLNGGWRVEDQHSTNGLFANGYRVTRHDLADGDVVRIGEYELVYWSGVAAPVKGAARDEDDELVKVLEDSSGETWIAPAPIAPVESKAPVKAVPAKGKPVRDEMFDDVGVEYGLAPAAAPARIPLPAYIHKPHSMAAVAAAASFNPVPSGPGEICPSCDKTLAAGAKICVTCGIKLKSGRPIVMSQGIDEETLYHNARQIITWLSWVVTLGIYPIASEGFGLKKPYAIWGLAAVTILVSLVFTCYQGYGGDMRSAKQLLLWSGSRDPDPQMLEMMYDHAENEGDTEAFYAKVNELAPTVPKKEVLVAAYKELTPREKCFGEFHFYQLLTHAFLHGGLMHLAGNMLFFLVFGTRVNALIGNGKTLILYPILAVIAAVVYMISVGDAPPFAMLGASGAIMGLAGMYLVLFPVHKVHMSFWIRPAMLLGPMLVLGVLLGFAWVALKLFIIFPVVIITLLRFARMLLRPFIKTWKLRGFWVVLFYLAFDIVATLRGSKDGTAHWAHLGGFIAGMVIALGLLLARQVNARGGDLLSVALGRYAWPLLGKPSQRKEDPELVPLPRAVAIPMQ